VAADVRSSRPSRTGDIDVIVLDITDEEDRQAAFAHDVDVLINNAGIMESGPAAEISMARVRKNSEVNVFGTLAMIQGIAPQMVKRGSGKIINVTSMGGLITVPLVSIYTATKHALGSITEGLKFELAGTGVEICTINPGVYGTGFNDRGAETMQRWLDPATSLTRPEIFQAAMEGGGLDDQLDPQGLIHAMAELAEEEGIEVPQRGTRRDHPLDQGHRRDHLGRRTRHQPVPRPYDPGLTAAGPDHPTAREIFTPRTRHALDEATRSEDLTGKTYIITGANSGVGLETTHQLLKQGGHVVMACRRVGAGEEAAASFAGLSGTHEVMRLDLADLQCVRDFVADFTARHDRLDGLACNAGMVNMRGDLERTTATIGGLHLDRRAVCEQLDGLVLCVGIQRQHVRLLQHDVLRGSERDREQKARIRLHVALGGRQRTPEHIRLYLVAEVLDEAAQRRANDGTLGRSHSAETSGW
jgi:NAD(P)-dependent dehydrogenase (short-subunit alcohol dehydrogenase family)